jgi:RNA polymerase sigma-70 factor (ECF subfamily)
MSVADRDRMGRALGRLPVDQRAVMVLHFYLDLPLTDAAEVLAIPVGTVKSRLHRGLETLRTVMSDDVDEPTSLVRERPA